MTYTPSFLRYAYLPTPMITAMNEGAGILLVSMLLANANRYDFEGKITNNILTSKSFSEFSVIYCDFVRLFMVSLFGYL